MVVLSMCYTWKFEFVFNSENKLPIIELCIFVVTCCCSSTSNCPPVCRVRLEPLRRNLPIRTTRSIPRSRTIYVYICIYIYIYDIIYIYIYIYIYRYIHTHSIHHRRETYQQVFHEVEFIVCFLNWVPSHRSAQATVTNRKRG